MTIQESRPLSTIDYRPFDLELSKNEQDRQLVLLHLQGDPDAFSIIAENHYRELTARARSLLGPHGEVEDAVQETFLRALRALPRFGITGEYKVGAWLTTILSNVCSDQRTRASKDRLLAESAGRDLPHQADVAEHVSDPQTVESLKAAIADLTPALRRAFIRHELDDMPYSVMAETENSSVELARQQVHRAKATLRRNLAGIESVAGGAVAFPFLQSLRIRFGARLGRGRALQTSSASGRFSRGTPNLLDRVATQVGGSSVGQSAMSFVTTSPRGSTLVFGMAAAVATLSAAGVVVTAVSQPSSPPAPQAVVRPALASSLVPLPTSAPADAQGSLAKAVPLVSPSTSTSGSVPSTTSPYSWVDAGSSDGPAPTTAPAGVPIGTCSIPVTDAGAGTQSTLGLGSALSVASAPAVALPTVGSTMQFTTGAALDSFSSATPGAIGVSFTTNACAASQGAWFSAQVTGVGSAPVQLSGSLVEVIGSPGDLGYIFRGQVDSSGLSPAAAPLLGGATEFVAQLEVSEPANMAQLTVVFLDPTIGTSGTSPPAGTADPTAGTAASPPASAQPVAQTSAADPATVGGIGSLPDLAPVVQIGMSIPTITSTPVSPPGLPQYSFRAAGPA